VAYVKEVTTLRMNLFTLIQILCLAFLWLVKSTLSSLAIPFFVLMLIPLRFSLKYFFSPKELEALDGTLEAKVIEEDPIVDVKIGV
jgi:hypothetical protein